MRALPAIPPAHTAATRTRALTAPSCGCTAVLRRRPHAGRAARPGAAAGATGAGHPSAAVRRARGDGGEGGSESREGGRVESCGCGTSSGPHITLSAFVLCMSWCADLEFRVTNHQLGLRSLPGNATARRQGRPDRGGGLPAARGRRIHPDDPDHPRPRSRPERHRTHSSSTRISLRYRCPIPPRTGAFTCGAHRCGRISATSASSWRSTRRRWQRWSAACRSGRHGARRRRGCNLLVPTISDRSHARCSATLVWPGTAADCCIMTA